MLVPKCYLDMLRERGLVVSDPFVSSHVAYPDGVVVGKPRSVAGNSIGGMECHWVTHAAVGEIILDAPTVYLHTKEGRWFVTVDEWTPGPGPGDVVDSWETPEQAVSDILDYFFGDPSRMQARDG